MKAFLVSLSVGVSFLILYYIYQIISGFYLAETHAPNIMHAYKEVDELKSEVEFGSVHKSPIVHVGIIVLGMVSYYISRVFKSKLAKN
ncbi:hypothetical protein [Paenibacillus sp. 1001270B_150601_E10]|uniref:hypothetical protein n=1 Tax=Paenibacillus sp. 1001270B_150601_E10 TaxID=2787079 RepID=UPI00189CC528|nr:hypothetical protein [Paenibacillus sp. 1001270B_150601_E10]